MGRLSGKVVRMLPDKQYGFIRPDGGKGDHFFHKDDTAGAWSDISIGSRVSFIVGESNKGPRAADISLIPIEEEGE